MWFEVNLVGLEGEKAVGWAREVKESRVPVETTWTWMTFEIWPKSMAAGYV